MVVGWGWAAVRLGRVGRPSTTSAFVSLRGEEVRCSVFSGLERVEEDDEEEVVVEEDVEDESCVVGACGAFSSGAADT